MNAPSGCALRIKNGRTDLPTYRTPPRPTSIRFDSNAHNFGLGIFSSIRCVAAVVEVNMCRRIPYIHRWCRRLSLISCRISIASFTHITHRLAPHEVCALSWLAVPFSIFASCGVEGNCFFLLLFFSSSLFPFLLIFFSHHRVDVIWLDYIVFVVITFASYALCAGLVISVGTF